MPPDPARSFRPRLTIRSLAVLVAFAAAGSAVAMPQLRRPGELYGVLFVLSVEVPYTLLIPSMVLIRRGPLKNWMVAALCSAPLIAFAILLGVGLYRTILGTWVRYTPFGIVCVAFLALSAGTIFLGLATLSRWVVLRACPGCRRLALFHDASVPGLDRFSWRSEARTCLACGSRFRRERREPWIDVDALGDREPSFATREGDGGDRSPNEPRTRSVTSR